MRKEFLIISIVLIVSLSGGGFVWKPAWKILLLLSPFLAIGYQDFFQKRHAIRRNFPILGRFRYMLEMIRPEIQQYFIESNTEGAPFSREQRSLVYQRSKKVLDTIPFGTQLDVYEEGYEWINHSMVPTKVDASQLRIQIGGKNCTQPYLASILNISAMSYGSLSQNAILALNGGAKDGGFAHNTGEGGLSHYHQTPGGDLIWQIGTAYFGCRDEHGAFSEALFKKQAQLDAIKMIEIKLSQGAKPGHGGILPKEKLTPEIAKIRGVSMGKDIISPPGHSAFSTPIEMMEFVERLRSLSGGKPVGIKLCLGRRREFLAVAKAMVETGITPDYIAVDGGEGGTGAAPVEFSNHIGTPGVEALIFVHNVLKGMGLRDQVKVIASGSVTSGFGIIKRLALGADLIYSARAFMLSLGCIQALRCNANVCPAGVATQDPYLTAGLVVEDKRKRVRNFHQVTLDEVAHMIGAMGLSHSSDLHPWHIMRRVNQWEIKHYGEIFDYLSDGSLLNREEVPQAYARAWRMAKAESFEAADTV